MNASSMNASLVKAARAVVLAALCIASINTYAQAPLPGCGNDIKLNALAQIRPGSTVAVFLKGSEPANGVLAAALANVNDQINGIKFVVVGVEPETGASIEVSFGGTCNGCAATYGAYGVGGYMATGEVKIATDAVCAEGKCFNPQMPNYREALVGTLTHEFLHALGASDSSYSNVMGKFDGINNVRNANLNLDCVLKQLRAVTAPPPGTPNPPYCS